MLSANLQRITNSISEVDVIPIAEELVSVASFTGEETVLANRVKEMLDKQGIGSFQQEVEPGRFQTIGWLGADPRKEKSALILNGHLDMDRLGQELTMRRSGDKLYGAGIHNMKSGLAAMIAAAMAIKKSGIELERGLQLQFVVGELQGGRGTRFALNQGLTADVAVVPEPYSVRHVLTRTAGVHKFGVVVEGKTAHTSRYEEGVDAIRALRGVLDLFDQTDLGLQSEDFPGLPRLQLASLDAGRGPECDSSSISYCADKAVALYDLRYPPPYEPEDVQRKVDAVVKQARRLYPEAIIKTEHPPDPRFGVGGTDMPPMDEPVDSLLVQQVTSLLSQVSDYSVEKIGAVLPYAYCGNDTTHLSRAGIPCCLFGPRGDLGKSEDHVHISEMVACARTLAGLVLLRCGAA